MSYRKCHCRWAIKHARPSFGQKRKQKTTTENKDLYGSEPGYIKPKRDDSYIRYLGWLA